MRTVISSYWTISWSAKSYATTGVGKTPHEDRQEAFVEWWDAYLKVKWINDTTWRIDVYFEERVQGWVSELRGDYARNLDLFDYAGTESGK